MIPDAIVATLILCFMSATEAGRWPNPAEDELIFIANPVESEMPGHWVPASIVKVILQNGTTPAPKPTVTTDYEKKDPVIYIPDKPHNHHQPKKKGTNIYRPPTYWSKEVEQQDEESDANEDEEEAQEESPEAHYSEPEHEPASDPVSSAEPEESEPEKSEPEKSEPEKSEPEKSDPEKSEPEKSEPEPPPPPPPAKPSKPARRPPKDNHEDIPL